MLVLDRLFSRPVAKRAESSAAVEAALAIIQTHLDREATNRRMPALQPRQLCPEQKVELLRDLRAALGV